MIGHVLFEGASTCAGAGDEERRGGFAGRAAYHYIGYDEQVVIRELRGPYPYIYPHTNGILNGNALKLVHTLPHSIEKARRLVWGSRPESTRIVGVFAIGGTLDTLARKFGREYLLERWQQSLIKIKSINASEGVSPIYVHTPFPDENTRFMGRPVDFELRDRQAEITTAELPECIPFESMVDPDMDRRTVTEQGPVHWGVHPNARGYRMITSHLIPLIDAQFGIDSRTLIQDSPQVSSETPEVYRT